jgi:hypothetical protein
MTAHPYDLVIGLDRSDQKADLCLMDPHTGQRRTVVIELGDGGHEARRRSLPRSIRPLREGWHLSSH